MSKRRKFSFGRSNRHTRSRSQVSQLNFLKEPEPPRNAPKRVSEHEWLVERDFGAGKKMTKMLIGDAAIELANPTTEETLARYSLEHVSEPKLTKGLDIISFTYCKRDLPSQRVIIHLQSQYKGRIILRVLEERLGLADHGGRATKLRKFSEKRTKSFVLPKTKVDVSPNKKARRRRSEQRRRMSSPIMQRKNSKPRPISPRSVSPRKRVRRNISPRKQKPSRSIRLSPESKRSTRKHHKLPDEKTDPSRRLSMSPTRLARATGMLPTVARYRGRSKSRPVPKSTKVQMFTATEPKQSLSDNEVIGLDDSFSEI